MQYSVKPVPMDARQLSNGSRLLRSRWDVAFSERAWGLHWDLFFYLMFWGLMILNLFDINVDFLGLAVMIGYVFATKIKMAKDNEPLIVVEEVIAILILIYVVIFEYPNNIENYRILLRPYLLLTLVVMASRGFMRNRKSMILAFLVLCFLAALLMVFPESMTVSMGGQSFERVGGMKIFSLIGGPNGASILGVAIIGLSFVLITNRQKIYRSRWYLIIAAMGTIIGIMTMIPSYSRTGIVMFVSCILCILYLAKYNKIIIIVAIFVMISSVILFKPEVEERYTDRFTHESSGSTRGQIYAITPQMLAATNPLGNGQQGSVELIRSFDLMAPLTPHNAFLRAYFDYGLPGLILTIFLYIRFFMKGRGLFRVSLKNSRNSKVTLSFVIVLGMGFLANTVGSNFGETLPSSMVLIAILYHWQLQYFFESRGQLS